MREWLIIAAALQRVGDGGELELRRLQRRERGSCRRCGLVRRERCGLVLGNRQPLAGSGGFHAPFFRRGVRVQRAKNQQLDIVILQHRRGRLLRGGSQRRDTQQGDQGELFHRRSLAAAGFFRSSSNCSAAAKRCSSFSSFKVKRTFVPPSRRCVREFCCT